MPDREAVDEWMDTQSFDKEDARLVEAKLKKMILEDLGFVARKEKLIGIEFIKNIALL